MDEEYDYLDGTMILPSITVPPLIKNIEWKPEKLFKDQNDFETTKIEHLKDIQEAARKLHRKNGYLVCADGLMLTGQYTKAVIKEKCVESGKHYSTAISILETNNVQKSLYRENRKILKARLVDNKEDQKLQIKVWEEEFEKQKADLEERVDKMNIEIERTILSERQHERGLDAAIEKAEKENKLNIRFMICADYILWCPEKKKFLRNDKLLEIAEPHKNRKRFSKEECRRLMNFTSFRSTSTMTPKQMRVRVHQMTNFGYWYNDEDNAPKASWKAIDLRQCFCDIAGYTDSYKIIEQDGRQFMVDNFKSEGERLMNSSVPMDTELSPIAGMKRALSSELNTPRKTKKPRLNTPPGDFEEMMRIRGYEVVPINKDSDSDDEGSTESEGTSAAKEATYQEHRTLAIRSFAGTNTNTDSLLNDEDTNADDY